jgi:hypothetical protein
MIYELMVDISGIEPPIWRKLRVPGNYTLGALHAILQIAFGWDAGHLHSFTVGSEEYGPEPEEIFAGDDPVNDENEVCLDDLHLRKKQKIAYLYDFGDSWQHHIVVSQIIPAASGREPPCCLDGKRAGPLEDSGGSWSYCNMLEILKNPDHEEYEEIREWAGDYDPEHFDLEKTNLRLKKTFWIAGNSDKGSAKAVKAETAKASAAKPKTAKAKTAGASLAGEKPDETKPAKPAKPTKTKPVKAQPTKVKPAKAKAPTAAQYKKLYHLMNRIKELAPWERLSDLDKVLLWLPGHTEPVLCIALGYGGESYGICVYPGYEAIASYIRIIQGQDENPFFIVGRQNYIACNLGGRNELLPEERARLKELGISFRGRNDWVYFRRQLPELYPWHINSADALLLIEVLTQFISAYSLLADAAVSVDFEKDQTLVHRYEGGTWTTRGENMPPVPVVLSSFSFGDGELDALRSTEKTAAVLEADMLYMPIPAGDNKEGIPSLRRLALLFNGENGVIVGQTLPEPGVKRERILLDMLLDYIEKFGRPKILKVRDAWEEAVFKGFCSKLDIKLIHSQGMPRTDAFSQSLQEMVEKL